jgi:hypothetical protein
LAEAVLLAAQFKGRLPARCLFLRHPLEHSTVKYTTSVGQPDEGSKVSPQNADQVGLPVRYTNKGMFVY